MDRFEFQQKNLDFKKLNFENVVELFDWAKEEGWNPGVNDAFIAYNSFPNDFIGYFIADEMIAAGSIVNYAGEFGFMGLFIVKKEYRSQGLGNLLWHQRKSLLISKLKSGASIGMDGVLSMQPFYSKGGFERLFTDERHELVGEQFTYSQQVELLDKKYVNRLHQFDEMCFGFKRTRFLNYWVGNSAAKTFVFVNENSLVGYAVIRQAIEGYKIGPLFAENKMVAKELFKACLTEVDGEKVSIDIPTINDLARELLDEFNSEVVFECGRMYYPKAPKFSFHKVFGITSLEFG
ncbi:MAG: GNAT family N-acetyltransferase [Crocinitomicaceae bacterium]|nr:GNAT family N-acetyltransferase [Crocinitomicaceae bacterium]